MNARYTHHSDTCIVCSSGRTLSDPADVEGHAILLGLGSYLAPAIVHYADRGLNESDLLHDIESCILGSSIVLKRGIVPVPSYAVRLMRLSFQLIYWYERLYVLLFRRLP